MIISVCHSGSFKEYCLPVLENIDYSVILEKDLFGLSKDKVLEFENADGVWYIKKCKGLSTQGTDLTGKEIRLRDKMVFRLELAGGVLQIICSDTAVSLRPYNKLDISSCARISIGKDPGNDICYEYMDLISKNHAWLLNRGGMWYIVDSSTNGVFLNNRRISGETVLSFGDTVSIFGLNIVYLGDMLAVDSNCGALRINRDAFGILKGVPMAARLEEQEQKYFNRSPRSNDHIYDERIEIEPPPNMQTGKKPSILQTIGPSFTMTIPMMLGCVLAIYNSKKSGMSGSAFMYTGIITAFGSALIGAFWAYRNLKTQRSDQLEHENKRFKTYSEYILARADEIREKYTNNYRALNKMYPSSGEVCRYNESSVQLWNRNPIHKDFLYHRIGLGEMPFQCELNIPKVKFSMDYDSLQSKPTMIGEQYKMLHNVPVGIDLMHENLYGIVGSQEKAGAINVMYNIAAQIAANNCYTDVKLVFIYNGDTPAARSRWNFFRWLPHVYSENRKLRFIASDKLEAADVFFELANVIRKRLDDEENRKVEFVRPHYVIFIEDYRLLDGEPIAKYLLAPHNKYGVTTFILSDYYYNLPNICENIIQNDEYGSFIYNAVDTENEKKKLVFDTVTPAELESFAKTIADVRVSEIESDSEIPNTLSFMDMYGAKKLEDLNVMERWRKNRTYNTMKALIGKKAGGVDCYLDIHEKYHGPHGLVAGTTGSGKSETLQTYIISLALNFSPEDVAFLIIDFKGGGMANLFDNLPHIAGTISNLSGNQIQRAMVSIKSEIRRRQIIFGENSVNNINSYTNLYKSKEATVPVPHLLIVIDEFAEMKREEPEFMRELISVAQVGRSLGIHLILATQKPSGTVDDNIWSNTKFRLCLRVQSRGDSMDMLHKPDAAYLSQAGRCYLQVGSDEIFELFQSGWSGAVFDPSDDQSEGSAVTMISLTGKAAIIGNRAKIKRNEENKRKWLTALCTEYLKALPRFETNVSGMDSVTLQSFIGYLIDKLHAAGFRVGNSEQEIKELAEFFKKYEQTYRTDLVSENVEAMLKSGAKLPELKEVSQLDAVVDYLGMLAEKSGLDPHLLLWLPPLKEKVFLHELAGYSELSYEKTKWQKMPQHFTLDAYVGLCDDPENQIQTPLSVDFAKNGHHAVIGAVVSGKSTFMQTLLYSLCDKYSPERVNMYILDFSSRSLAPFAKAPHCGGVITEKDIDKVGKLFNMINKFIAERKALFNGGTYTQYVNAYGVTVPAVIIAIDNYASFAEKTEGRYEQFMNRLAREGAGYGIFLLLSAQGFGINEIPNRLADNIGSVITVNLGDKFKYLDALKTTSIPLIPEAGVKGRGLAYSGERLLEYQTAIAFDAKDDYARLKAMEDRFAAMRAAWDKDCARDIPTIPAEPVFSLLAANPDYKSANADKKLIPYAYRLADASVYSVDLSQIYCYTISGKPRTGKTNVLKLLIEGAKSKDANMIVFENGTEELAAISSEAGARYITTDEQLCAFFTELLPDFAARNKRKKALASKGLTDNDIYEEMSSEKPYFIFVNDLVRFFTMAYNPSEGVSSMGGFLENIIEKGALHNVFFFGCIDTEKAFEASGFKAYTEFTKYKKGVHLGGAVSSQQIFTFMNVPFNETTRPYKKGIGMVPDYEDETQGEKIIIPIAGR